MTLRSAGSLAPKLMYSPPERPLPLKSKQQTLIEAGSKSLTTSLASSRQPQLPWRYTTHVFPLAHSKPSPSR